MGNEHRLSDEQAKRRTTTVVAVVMFIFFVGSCISLINAHVNGVGGLVLIVLASFVLAITGWIAFSWLAWLAVRSFRLRRRASR
jgi:cation transporter-like permease